MQNQLFSKTDYALPDAEISLTTAFFTKEESDKIFQDLLENTQWENRKIKMFGKTYYEPRLTAWYGDPGTNYSYSGIKLIPLPWNKVLLSIKKRIETETGHPFNSVLLNYYRDGQDSMGWHQDNEKELGQNPTIASLSLGATRPFQLKHIQQKEPKKATIPLTHGSLLLMKGTTQHYWKHQIPKTKKPLKPRINLTFRTSY